MEKLLEKELFLIYKRTYPTAEYERIWNAYDAVLELWHRVAGAVAEYCGFIYPEATEKNMVSFIENNAEGMQ